MSIIYLILRQGGGIYMNAIDLIISNFEEIRSRSIKVWRAISIKKEKPRGKPQGASLKLYFSTCFANVACTANTLESLRNSLLIVGSTALEIQILSSESTSKVPAVSTLKWLMLL